MTNKLMDMTVKNNICGSFDVGVEAIKGGVKMTGFLSNIQAAVEEIKRIAPENMNIYVEQGGTGYSVFYEIVER